MNLHEFINGRAAELAAQFYVHSRAATKQTDILCQTLLIRSCYPDVGAGFETQIKPELKRDLMQSIEAAEKMIALLENDDA